MFAKYWKNASEYVNMEKASGIIEAAKAAAMDVADAANKVSETVQAEYRRTFEDLDCQIYHVRPELSVMEYPSDDKIERLAVRLNADFSQKMLIYNMSERKYDTSKFQAEVVDVAFRGLPAPPLELLLELCLSAHNWLASDPGNVIIVHCFEGFSRSAVFLSCFMAFRGLYGHPVDALHDVCQKLNLSDATAISPSQRRYLTYFQQCQQGRTPYCGRLRLQRAQLNGIPSFQREGNVAFRPYIEVWHRGELAYSSLAALPGNQSAAGSEASPSLASGVSGSGTTEDGVAMPPGFSSSDPCVAFQLPSSLILAGDVLVRVRHVHADGSRDTALRLVFHTGFVPLDRGMQLTKTELDTACDDSRVSKEFFVDLAFVQVAEEEGAALSEPPAVFEKAREISKRLQQEQEDLRRQAATEAAAAKAKASLGTDDELSALEETLKRPVGGPGAGSASDATELQRLLAAAAAEDSPSATGAATSSSGGDKPFSPPPRQASSATATPSASASSAPVESAASMAPVAEAPPKTSEAAPAAKPAFAASVPEAAADPATRGTLDEKVRSSRNEIDELFSDFDAALASVTTAPTPAAGKAAAATPASAPAQAGGSEASKTEKPAASGEDDPFAEADAFLKELGG